MSVQQHADARPERRQISRRTLVKAGANAVWAVPAIQMVSAAPAFATCTSGQPSGAAFTFNLSATWVQQGNSGKWYVVFNGTITNQSCTTVNNLQVSVTVPNTWDGVQPHSPSGWSAGSSTTRTLVLTSTASRANGTSWDFGGNGTVVQVREGDSTSNGKDNWEKFCPTQISVVATSGSLSAGTAVNVTGC